MSYDNLGQWMENVCNRYGKGMNPYMSSGFNVNHSILGYMYIKTVCHLDYARVSTKYNFTL